MIELLLRNATNIRVDGIVSSFITPRGNIAGQFLESRKLYDFEIEDGVVYYQSSYRQDAEPRKGKKCPRGYWIPKKHNCRQGTMTPSAKGKMGGVKKAIAAGLIGAGGIAIAAKLSKKNESSPSRKQLSLAGGAIGAAGLAGAGVAATRKKKGRGLSVQERSLVTATDEDDFNTLRSPTAIKQDWRNHKTYNISAKDIEGIRKERISSGKSGDVDVRYLEEEARLSKQGQDIKEQSRLYQQDKIVNQKEITEFRKKNSITERVSDEAIKRFIKEEKKEEINKTIRQWNEARAAHKEGEGAAIKKEKERRSSPSTSPSKSQKSERDQRIELAESKIVNKPYEMALVLDSKTGKMLNYSSGDQTSVKIVIPPGVNPKDIVVTHNHPQDIDPDPNSVQGSFYLFSLDDIGVACTKGIGEVRMVTPGYRLSMKPPKTGWDKSFYKGKVLPSWDKHRKAIYARTKKAIEQGDLKYDNWHKVQMDVYKEVWKEVVKETGMEYKMEKINGESPRHSNLDPHLGTEVVKGVRREVGLLWNARK